MVACEEKYEKGKTVDSILTQVARKHEGTSAEELYEKIGFPLAKEYGHAYDAFKLSISSVTPRIPPVKTDDPSVSPITSLDPSTSTSPCWGTSVLPSLVV